MSRMGGGVKGGEIPESGSLEGESGPEVSAEAIEAARAGEAPSDGAGDRVEELLSEVAALRRELADAKTASERALRRAEIERALTAAGVIDLEITTPLVEEAMDGMEEPDVGEAVRGVRSGKGFLFRPAVGAGRRGSLMAGEGVGGVGLEDLAGDARSSGDRGDLLRYLRARRS